MAQYRIYLLNRDDRITSPAIEWEGADDDAAVTFARQLLAVCAAVEIWEVTRLVGKIDGGDRPALSQNAASNDEGNWEILRRYGRSP
jgi:hypothetical protein